MRKPKSSAFLILLSILMLLGSIRALWTQKRPMTFMDVICLNRIRGTALSANRQYFLYEVSSLDWRSLLKTLEEKREEKNQGLKKVKVPLR